MRAAPLSDDQVISAVNEFFVAVEINVTKDGFPSQLPAMKLVEGIYNSNWRNEFGFASCLALDSDGKFILGTSAVVKDIQEKLDPELLFSPKRYLEFIVTAIERFRKLQGIQQLPLLQKFTAWQELLRDVGSDVQSQIQMMAKFKASLA